MRFEYKYLVDLKDLESVRNDFSPYLEYDYYSQINDAKDYTVRSIYYDTNSLRFYREKIEGIKNRKKIRIRTYNRHQDFNPIFLEIKRKYGDKIIKNRSVYDAHLYSELLEKRCIVSAVNSQTKTLCENSTKFMHNVLINSLVPTVLISYDREAYFSKINNSLRITFDKNIRYSVYPEFHTFFNDSELKNALEGYFILEIKFNTGFPKWISQIIQKHSIVRKSLSKYSICIDDNKCSNYYKN